MEGMKTGQVTTRSSIIKDDKRFDEDEFIVNPFTAKQQSIQARQKREIDDIEVFSQSLSKRKKLSDPKDLVYRLGEKNPFSTVEDRQQAIEDVRRYVREDEPSSTVSKKELKNREKRYREKIKYASRSYKAQQEITDEIAVQDDKLEEKHIKKTTFNDVLGPITRRNPEYNRESIEFIDTLNIDALCYTDDNEFLNKSKDWMLQIAKAEKLAELLNIQTNEDVFNEYLDACNITDIEIRGKVIDEIRDKVSITLRHQKEYIQTKLQLIQNPYYSLLSKADLGKLEPDELEEKANFFEMRERHTLHDYLLLLVRLKKMTDPDGQYKLTRSRNVVKAKTKLSRKKNGSLTTTTTKTEVLSHEVHHKVNGSITATPSFLKWGAEKTYHSKDDVSDVDMTTETSYADEKGKYGEKEVAEVAQSQDGFLEASKNQILSSLGVSYELGTTGSLIKKSKVRKNGNTELSASGSVFSGLATGTLGATLFDAKGLLAPSADLSVEIEGSVFEGELKAETKKTDKKYGLILYQASGKAKGALGKAKGKLKGTIGLIRYKKKDAEGNEFEVSEFGQSFTASGGVYAATGSVTGTIGAGGFALTAKAEGSFGLGGSFKYVHTTGRIQVTLGVVFGLGGKISFTFEYGNALDAIKKYIGKNWFKGLRKWYKKKTKAKRGAHSIIRATNIGPKNMISSGRDSDSDGDGEGAGEGDDDGDSVSARDSVRSFDTDDRIV